MQRTMLLWVDLTRSVRQAELPPAISEYCATRICTSIDQIDGELCDGGIDAVCFDMDYPDFADLDLLRNVKNRYPQLPVFMLTVQHSESLAVWAFRSRVYDYFVKPVSRLEFARSARRLSALRSAETTDTPRNLIGDPPAVPADTPIVPKPAEMQLMPALCYVERNFRCKVKSAGVAKLCDMSPFRFSRAFHEAFGMTFQEYVLRYRVTESLRLLAHPDANVTDVAYAVGFGDASYFSRVFRRYLNVSPKAFKEQNEQASRSIRGLTGPGQILELPTARHRFRRDAAAAADGDASEPSRRRLLA